MARPIKSDLFRFVTVRNPQLLTDEEKQYGFIYNDELTTSTFYQSISALPESDLSGRRTALRQVASTFTPLAKVANVKAINPALGTFASWLARNRKKAITIADVAAKISGVTPLTNADLALLWENLYFQTVNKKSSYVREAIIQLIVANKFLVEFNAFITGFSEDQNIALPQHLKRTACARVVVPKNMVMQKPKAVQDHSSTSTSSNQQQSTAQVASTLQNLNNLEQAIDELKKVHSRFLLESESSYTAAVNTYEQEVDTLKQAITPVVDPETGEETYPGLVLPDFSYSVENSLSTSYLTDKISAGSLTVVQDLGLDVYNDIPQAITAIEDEMKKLNGSLFGRVDLSNTVVSHQGEMITIEESSSSNSSTAYSYILRNIVSPPSIDGSDPDPIDPITGDEFYLDLTLNTGYNASVTAMSYTISFGGVEETGSTFVPTPLNQSVRVTFPSTPVTSFPGIVSVNVQGQISLDNGDVLAFNSIVSQSESVSGTAVLISSNGDDGSGDNGDNSGGDGNGDNSGGDGSDGSDESTDTSVSDVIGISQLGVADYRRVEQEICCYVPGEVSHIENIMQGEYKERANRKLRRSEDTLETSSELESESQTDTSSTERNELQREISSIINEDRSFATGFSGGKTGKFFFNASADFASNTSTSESDAQAVSYAQEVTEQALERIVQKVSEKRISKIIEETEDTNTHGFNNIGGKSHVSGVYRWIDKVYKNTVVNYGKRLMYEFMVPEPAAFLKNGENRYSNLSLLKEPIDPRGIGAYQIANHTDVSLSKYAFWAATYNAEVTPPPSEMIQVGKSYDFERRPVSSATEGKYVAHTANDIEIPEGYVCSNAKVNCSFHFHPNDPETPHVSIIVGDKATRFHFNRNELNINPVPLSFTAVKDALPVSAKGDDIEVAAYNVVAECERTSEYYEQWQLETFNAIITAYEARKAAYDEAVLAELQKAEEAKATYNPLEARRIEQNELKKSCLELLLRPFNFNFEPGNLRDGKGLITRTKSYEQHARRVKFFEQAFEWDVMSYLFYPYFWADQEQWERLFNEEDTDPLFKAFLQSGMARTVVSVRPGFEEAVMYYLETGEIFEGRDITFDDDLHLSIVEELQQPIGEVEGEPWETKLPTSLTLLQARSGVLDENGLPCFCEDEEAVGQAKDGIDFDIIEGDFIVQ
ncbi:hypothetical protein GTQ40_08230 [Flavobacteriaceae bacterium R38]|nr:hypothetical protein [Flavobacteriaceae bacterium R38]